MTPNEISTSMIDPLEHLLGYQLRRASLVLLCALVDSLGELGLRPTEAVIIRFVHANPGCTQAAIGRALGVQRTNMVPIANGLIQRGFIKRKPADGRSHSLYLTAKGTALHRKIETVSLAQEARFFGDIAPDVRETLMGVFRAVRAKGGTVNEIAESAG